MIAGFDMEAGRVAADGTTYNNGYGICFIPKTRVTTSRWNDDSYAKSGYNSSVIHNTHLPNIVTKLRGVLGSHIVQRNVLLSSSVDSNYYSNAYTWSTAYATLMSVGQMTGNFAANTNKYDDGEANYKLPVFNFMEYRIGTGVWTRGLSGITSAHSVYCSHDDGSIIKIPVTYTRDIRPLIYLR